MHSQSWNAYLPVVAQFGCIYIFCLFQMGSGKRGWRHVKGDWIKPLISNCQQAEHITPEEMIP